MARPKYDGIVQAVHYTPQGQVAWVRVFLRRGPTWSDVILLDRQSLIDQIGAGKRFMAGDRVPLLAGSFEVSKPIKILSKDDGKILITGDLVSEKDCLDGVPLV
jgi:hypothetical protein